MSESGCRRRAQDRDIERKKKGENTRHISREGDIMRGKRSERVRMREDTERERALQTFSISGIVREQ
jgi:hypothetical protein